MPDRAAQPGAPVTESEVTPEMIEAGAEVIWRCFDETLPYGSSFGERVAVLVYRAMDDSRGPNQDKGKARLFAGPFIWRNNAR